MCAKLLEFYGLSLTRVGVEYFLMTDDKPNIFKFDANLSDVFADPEFIVGGILFGAQASMVAREVVNTVMYNPRSTP